MGQYRGKTTPVGSFKPNALGLYDMHGNVSQWCQDWFDGNYYTDSPKTDPQGPNSGKERVRRGGGLLDYPVTCRSASRLKWGQVKRNGTVGFRLVALAE